jgi:hypothetical protein
MILPTGLVFGLKCYEKLILRGNYLLHWLSQYFSAYFTINIPHANAPICTLRSRTFTKWIFIGHERALDRFMGQEEICRSVNYLRGLAVSYVNQAQVQARLGNDRRAIRLAEDAGALAHEQGYSLLAERIRNVLEEMKNRDE